jgi:hypothetical protein
LPLLVNLSMCGGNDTFTFVFGAVFCFINDFISPLLCLRNIVLRLFFAFPNYFNCPFFG